ncbi:hypothetical protein FQN54_006714 [Arachnomyces sp. PD_36]|nr:hypothetical protein FQN54_006714 [Arachnomyces sp. PD_36]
MKTTFFAFAFALVAGFAAAAPNPNAKPETAGKRDIGCLGTGFEGESFFFSCSDGCECGYNECKC